MTKNQIEQIINNIEAEHGVKRNSYRRRETQDGGMEIIKNGRVIIKITAVGGVLVR